MRSDEIANDVLVPTTSPQRLLLPFVVDTVYNATVEVLALFRLHSTRERAKLSATL